VPLCCKPIAGLGTLPSAHRRPSANLLLLVLLTKQTWVNYMTALMRGT